MFYSIGAGFQPDYSLRGQWEEAVPVVGGIFVLGDFVIRKFAAPVVPPFVVGEVFQIMLVRFLPVVRCAFMNTEMGIPC